jgi:excisionase family DNA binding protein
MTTELTPREAARRLRVSLYFIYQSLWAGKLPAHKVDGRWRIPAKAVDERLRAQAERQQQTNAPTQSKRRAR